MKINDIRTMAKGRGLKTANMKKVAMIRAIQTQEGNSPCFATSPEHCGQTGCLWREDCLAATKK